MGFQRVPNTAQAFIRASSGGKTIGNRLMFQRPGGYTAQDLIALASLVDAWVASDYLAWISTGVSYLMTEVRGLDAENDYVVTDDTSSGNGEVTGLPLANNVTLAFRLLSEFTGRDARGRIYALPTAASQLSSATQFSGTYGDNLELAFQGLRQAAANAGWVWAVVSRMKDGVMRPEGRVLPVVTISRVNNQVDSQRGRLAAKH